MSADDINRRKLFQAAVAASAKGTADTRDAARYLADKGVWAMDR